MGCKLKTEGAASEVRAVARRREEKRGRGEREREKEGVKQGKRTPVIFFVFCWREGLGSGAVKGRAAGNENTGVEQGVRARARRDMELRKRNKCAKGGDRRWSESEQ